MPLLLSTLVTEGPVLGHRFLWVIQFYVGNGFYVAIDFHGQGSSTVDQTIVSTPAVFQQNWIALATAIKSLPTYDTYLKGPHPFPPYFLDVQLQLRLAAALALMS